MSRGRHGLLEGSVLTHGSSSQATTTNGLADLSLVVTRPARALLLFVQTPTLARSHSSRDVQKLMERKTASLM